MEVLHLTPNATREARYQELLPQISGIMEGEPNLIANLANIAAILHEGLGSLWTGWYLTTDEGPEPELVLGPFQGPLACTRIAFGKGVCGTAAASRQTQIVPDVHAFPGHIACSALSRSEIVVPLVANNSTRLVLDIDSAELAAFSELDAQYLGEVLHRIAVHHGWINA